MLHIHTVFVLGHVVCCILNSAFITYVPWKTMETTSPASLYGHVLGHGNGNQCSEDLFLWFSSSCSLCRHLGQLGVNFNAVKKLQYSLNSVGSWHFLFFHANGWHLDFLGNKKQNTESLQGITCVVARQFKMGTLAAAALAVAGRC